jgi:hypothetical protein
VVRGTVPDRCVAAGVPARVVRRYQPGEGWSPGPGVAGPGSGVAVAELVEGFAQAPDPPR